MADITRSTSPKPSLCTRTPGAEQQLNAIAAVDIAQGDMVYLSSTGWRKANGSAADALALAVGMAPKDASAGEPLTVFFGVQFSYATGMTPGARLYVSANAGNLADAASTGGTVPVAIVTTATTILVLNPTR